MDHPNSTTNENNSKPVHKYLVHQPLGNKKKFYLSEFLSENIIRIVAFVSIAAILAIFYYVFQEATYAFRAVEKKENVPAEVKSEESFQSEEYVSESYSAGEAVEESNEPIRYESESYSPDGVAEESLEADTYGIDTDSEFIQSDEDLATSDDDLIYEDLPVTIAELIYPNDVIDEKPAYIWQPISSKPKYSFVPLFIGALKVTVISILLAAPIAILAAIFTVAFAPRWMREIIKPAIEILAGFPSVVIGFFALMTLATIIQQVFGTPYRLNAFVGGVGMALAVIPIIYTVTEDALSAVPKYMKEASLAIGSSRWQTAWRVTLPAAIPGVFAAIILGFGRAFGETMIALMATGNAALVSADIFDSVRTMAATIGAEMAEVEFRSYHYGVLFLIGALLFVITFTLNALAEFYVRNKLMKKFQGK